MSQMTQTTRSVAPTPMEGSRPVRRGHPQITQITQIARRGRGTQRGKPQFTQMSPESKTASTLVEPNPSLASPRAAFAVRLGTLWALTLAFWLLTYASCGRCGLRGYTRIVSDGSHNQQPESRQRSHDAPPLPSSMGHIRSPHVRLAARARFPICYPGIKPPNVLTQPLVISY